MNEPRPPEDPPPHGASPDSNPAGKTPHGIPSGAEDQQPKARPTSDRAQTETAANKS
jgi:hypothetical protein